MKQDFNILACSYSCINITTLNKFRQMHSHIIKTPLY